MKITVLNIVTAIVSVCSIAVQASPASDSAYNLFAQGNFREAESALREVIKAEPANAAACHTLGSTLIASQANTTIDKAEAEARVKEAARWFARAAELEPKNAAYLRDFGMSQITGVTSLKKGRKILEQALSFDPKDPDTREFLAMIYGAPWMLGGDKDKAAEHRRALQEIDPNRAALSEINRLLWIDKDFPAALSFSEALLEKEPESAVSNFVYGYVSATTKTNLERGLACLKKALEVHRPATTGNSAYSQPLIATPSNFWQKIGEIEGHLGHAEEARAAYTIAVQLDPNNYWAAKALE